MSQTQINAGTSDPTDGREKYDWQSRYPTEAKKRMLLEFLYISTIFLFSIAWLFSVWYGCFFKFLNLTPDQILIFKKFCYFSSAGMLGGVTYGIKYFYRTVARGYWHVDRIYWRLLSPFVSMTISIVFGSLFASKLISSPLNLATGSSFVILGFFAGYFSDNALGKMMEVAEVIFGKVQKPNN